MQTDAYIIGCGNLTKHGSSKANSKELKMVYVIKATIALEGGKRYEFDLLNGTTKQVAVIGSHQSKSGDEIELEVDGQVGKYGTLNEALGCSYVKVSEVEV